MKNTADADNPQSESKKVVQFAALCLLLVFLFILNLSLSSVSISPENTLTILFGGESEDYMRTIVMEMRLPKALTAVLAGSALAIAGLLMQSLFRNPLADPYVLGINSGASLGVALVMLAMGSAGVTLLEGFNIGLEISVVLAATLGAGAVLLLVLLLASRVDILTLLLVGLMIGYMASAFSSILMYMSLPERIQAYLSWTYGHFGQVDWRKIQVFAPVVFLGIAIAVAHVKSLNAFVLGEAYAQSVGVHTKRARFFILAASAILAGSVTAYCGPIGFIGVAVPHICRGILKTSDHKLLVPACLLTGGSVALAADLIAQVPGSQLTLPLNAITALIGAPVIISILLRSKHYRKSFGQ